MLRSLVGSEMCIRDRKADDFAALSAAGFTDEGVAEILAHVALNIFTNYTNVAFAVPVDFPDIKLSDQAVA